MGPCRATSPRSPLTEAVTEFCVIHIEDGQEQVSSEPIRSPIRTVAKPEKEVAHHDICNSEALSLPGIPDTENTSAHDHDINDSISDPQASWCGSSVSSEVSVKSTDALMKNN